MPTRVHSKDLSKSRELELTRELEVITEMLYHAYAEGLEAEVLHHYAGYRMDGEGPQQAANGALYEWDV